MRSSLIPHCLAIGVLVVAGTTSGAMAQSAGYWQQDSFWGGGATPSVSYTNPDDTVRFNAGVGVIYLEGNEKVMNGDYTVSHLIWQSTAPVLRGGLAVDFGGGFTASVEGSTAAFGTGYMED